MEKYFVARKALLVNPQGRVSASLVDADDGGNFLMSKTEGETFTLYFWKMGALDGATIDPRQPLPESLVGIEREVLQQYIRRERVMGLDERIKGRTGYGLVQMIYGNGKGKTTASLGQAVRCAGSGRKVLIVYFDKGGTSHYSERAIIKTIPNIHFEATGRDRIDPVTGRFDFSITDEDRAEARRGLDVARKALREGGYDLVILDEINSTASLGMLNEQDVVDMLDNKLEDIEVILTGRNPFDSFLDRAHIVTEMKLERHYFYSGVPAREGLDY